MIYMLTVYKKIIGKKLKDFTGNLLKLHYSISTIVASSPFSLFTFGNIKHFIQCTFFLTCSIYFMRMFSPLKGDLQFISIAVTLCYHLTGTSIEEIKCCFMSCSKSKSLLCQHFSHYSNKMRALAFRYSQISPHSLFSLSLVNLDEQVRGK